MRPMSRAVRPAERGRRRGRRQVSATLAARFPDLRRSDRLGRANRAIFSVIPRLGSTGRDGSPILWPEVKAMTARRDSARASGASLISEFAGDDEMRELITMFVDELPERVRALRALTDSGELDGLRRLAHQLKGAGGGYGFPSLGHAAGRLEDLVGATLAHADPAERLPQIRAQVDELIELCRRVRAA